MTKPRVSLCRLLIADNDPNTPTYSDAQLLAAMGIPPPASALPAPIRLAALVSSVELPA